ncbi:MAG: ABC transporter permease [Candidatus Omnitrophica bacterium]|nr:ABC transporter permease [Candidatus Omnitrophota bacterium]
MNNITVIKPTHGWRSIDLKELWKYRELLWIFVARDIKVRYKQTVLGASWAVLQPFMTMVVFSIFFGRLAKMPSEGIPYPVFSFAALVPWTFFANGLAQCSNSLVVREDLVKKVYFPRLILPISSVLGGIVDFAIAFMVLIGIMLFYGIFPTVNIVWLPFFIFLSLITALGSGMWLTTMNIQFRDIRYALPFLVQFWMFATPIVYPAGLLSAKWKMIYALNPMVGVIEGFRWALLGTDTRPEKMIIISTLVSVTILITGAFYFKRAEKGFADIL